MVYLIKFIRGYLNILSQKKRELVRVARGKKSEVRGIQTGFFLFPVYSHYRLLHYTRVNNPWISFKEMISFINRRIDTARRRARAPGPGKLNGP